MIWRAILKSGEEIEAEDIIYFKIKDRLAEVAALQLNVYGRAATVAVEGAVFAFGDLIWTIGDGKLNAPFDFICGPIERVNINDGDYTGRKCTGARLGIVGTNDLGEREKRTFAIYMNGAVSIDRQVIGSQESKG